VGRDPRIADEKLRLVEKVIQGRDFTAMAETINAVDAWLGAPGHVYANVRQPPISTLNLAHMIPWRCGRGRNGTSISQRPRCSSARPKARPRSGFPSCRRCRPYADRRPDRRGQVGAAGADGAAVPALCRAQVFAFDFGGSIRAAALAMRGDWHDLGGGLTEGARPSASAARPHRRRPERAWAADWLVAILPAKASPSPRGEGAHLDGADLAGLGAGRGTHHHRPCVLLQSNDLKQALRPIASAAPMGGCSTPKASISARRRSRRSRPRADRHRRRARRARLSLPPHRGPARRIADALIIDEGWLALDDEGFAGQLREWLKTLRKKNASVIFATQSLSDIDGSAIAPAIIESCQTRLLLPNERAIEPQITAIYRRFGLNDRQIEIIARAMPKRDYYCQSRRGNRLFELGLSDVALALCAASSKTDQPRSRGCSPSTARTASSPPGCAIATSAGPPTSFQRSP
jgi:type IV secretion system protein VirB4